MYSTCLFCHASLGRNEAVEAFPIGRRLAYDAEKGRLWAVCRKCARWNLTPVEERWEAIEECERAFSNTRLRVSTDNVGLARLREGLELVRIGKPQRPEFAAWRYGDQFRRRHTKYLIGFGALLTGTVGGAIAGPLLGAATLGAVLGGMNMIATGFNLYQQNRARARIQVPWEKRPAVVRFSQLEKIRIQSVNGRWRIAMPIDGAILTGSDRIKQVVIEGEPAMRGAATILAICNAYGANQKQLQEAVRIVGDACNPSALFIDATKRSWKVNRLLNRWVEDKSSDDGPSEVALTDIRYEMRLALEMATNEDIERRAMEGELAILEEAWRQAEEIASIADNLDLAKPGDSLPRS